MEWQALEGLCTVSYQQNRLEKCFDYLQRALVAVSAHCTNSATTVTIKSTEADQQRIVNKLTRLAQIQGAHQITSSKKVGFCHLAFLPDVTAV